MRGFLLLETRAVLADVNWLHEKTKLTNTDHSMRFLVSNGIVSGLAHQQ